MGHHRYSSHFSRYDSQVFQHCALPIPFNPYRTLFSCPSQAGKTQTFPQYPISLCVACGWQDEAAVLQHKNRGHIGTCATLSTGSLILHTLKSMKNVNQLHQPHSRSKPRKFHVSMQEVSFHSLDSVLSLQEASYT